MEKFILTVVVAVKEWHEADVLRLVYSLSVMPLAKKMQMVLVFSNNSPESMIVNLNSNIGYFYYQSSTKLYVWKYTFKITNKEYGIKRATLKLILEEDKETLTDKEMKRAQELVESLKVFIK